MYSNVTRSDEYKRRFLDFIKNDYGIEAIKLTPAKRGFYGETWRLDAVDASYFIKLVYVDAHMLVYERSFPIIQHLCDHGINFISRIRKSNNGSLSTRFDGAVLGVFDWIDGELTENDDTKIPEYEMLAKVYAVPLHGVSIPHEDFSSKNADKFFELWSELSDNQILLLLERNRAKIEHRANRLRHFSNKCKGETTNFFITHGDAGGNLIVSGDRYFIVDWDNPISAPPERDAWVMCSRDWARDAFQDALLRNGIKHILRKERLAFYCYDFFFFYLSAFLDALAQVDLIEEYIDGWIEDSINYADNNF